MQVNALTLKEILDSKVLQEDNGRLLITHESKDGNCLSWIDKDSLTETMVPMLDICGSKLLNECKKKPSDARPE